MLSLLFAVEVLLDGLLPHVFGVLDFLLLLFFNLVFVYLQSLVVGLVTLLDLAQFVVQDPIRLYFLLRQD